MPEIGEIQAHAERIESGWSDKSLTNFRPITFYVLKTFSPDPITSHGQVLRAVTTRGKYFQLRFDTVVFTIHLMQGGRLRPDSKQSKKPRGGQARWTFDDGTALLLTEAGSDKRAGIWVHAASDDLNSVAPLAGLGPNADDLTAALLANICADNSMRIHGLLRRQKIIAGIGRRLANDICHEAMISPFASAKRLTDTQIASINNAIHTCIGQSLDFERAQTEIVSSAKRPSVVHNKAGEPCPRCGNVIRAVEYNAYTVSYCATCQTKGKVLADNTTSKFLK